MRKWTLFLGLYFCAALLLGGCAMERTAAPVPPSPDPASSAGEEPAPAATVYPLRRAASDSNLRCSKEEWPACSMVVGRRQGQDATKAA